MRFFMFIVFIPVLAAVITAVMGFSYFNSETFWLALAINFPICFISASIYAFTS